jgi:hypothetical protein
MAAVAVIGLNVDERDADPKDTYALIFGIVAVFLILLFFFQSRDLSAAERGETKAVAQEEIENPATMEEPALWASMAVKPIDKDALRARKDVWGAARGSMRLGMLICVLIFLAVPPIYLFDTFVPLLIGAPLARRAPGGHRLAARDRRDRHGRSRAALQPEHRRGARLRVHCLELPDLTRGLLADVAGWERGGPLDRLRRVGAHPRHALRWPRGRRALLVRARLLERHHVGAGALRVGVEYPGLAWHGCLRW